MEVYFCFLKQCGYILQGLITFGAVATDMGGQSSEAIIELFIIDSDNVATITVSKEIAAVQSTIDELKMYVCILCPIY